MQKVLINLTFATHQAQDQSFLVVHENLSALATTLTCDIELGIRTAHDNLQSM